MGKDKLRYFREINGRYFWDSSKQLKELGLVAEALGTDEVRARARAAELNALADQVRRGAEASGNGPLPGSFARLVRDFKASDEFKDLKPRTQRDYTYYLGKIEDHFAPVMVRAMTPKIIKTYYKRVRKQVSVTWAYHILATLRAILSWAVSEEWVSQNHALDVSMKSPQKRKITWAPEQAETYVAKAKELGWHSIAAMALVFDSIGQSPVDVRTLLRKSYDGQRIAVSRTKTGVGGAPITIFPEAIKELDAYLEANPRLPEAPLFANDKIGGEWNESTLQKKHRIIRAAAGLPKNLQLQDFRTTAATEGGAASGTVDELRALQRHSTRSAGEHYVIPDPRFVDSIQAKRLAHRNESKAKVGMEKK